MGFFDKYPNTDFHEINMDWILAKIQALKDRVKGLEDAIHDIVVVTPNNGKLTIKRNNTIIGDFTADQATDEDINIAVPENTSDLNNDSDFITSSDLPDMTDYYDKTETDALLADKADVSDLPDMTDYYDKTETDALLTDKADISSLATVATTGAYADLTGQPTIPAAANNGQLTIQKNGSNVATFTANQSGNTTANITCENKISWTTSGSWRYWKDSAGVSHAYYNNTVSAAMTSALGNLFYRNSVYTVNFPFNFSGIYNIQVTCQDGSGLTGATIQNYSNTGVSLWLWAGNSGTRTIRLHIEVIGT